MGIIKHGSKVTINVTEDLNSGLNVLLQNDFKVMACDISTGEIIFEVPSGWSDEITCESGENITYTFKNNNNVIVYQNGKLTYKDTDNHGLEQFKLEVVKEIAEKEMDHILAFNQFHTIIVGTEICTNIKQILKAIDKGETTMHTLIRFAEKLVLKNGIELYKDNNNVYIKILNETVGKIGQIDRLLQIDAYRDDEDMTSIKAKTPKPLFVTIQTLTCDKGTDEEIFKRVLEVKTFHTLVIENIAYTSIQNIKDKIKKETVLLGLFYSEDKSIKLNDRYTIEVTERLLYVKYDGIDVFIISYNDGLFTVKSAITYGLGKFVDMKPVIDMPYAGENIHKLDVNVLFSSKVANLTRISLSDGWCRDCNQINDTHLVYNEDKKICVFFDNNKVISMQYKNDDGVFLTLADDDIDPIKVSYYSIKRNHDFIEKVNAKLLGEYVLDQKPDTRNGYTAEVIVTKCLTVLKCDYTDKDCFNTISNILETSEVELVSVDRQGVSILLPVGWSHIEMTSELEETYSLIVDTLNNTRIANFNNTISLTKPPFSA